MQMNFISLFKRSTYGNTYIFNLVDYFLRHNYHHLISSINITDVILLFNSYLQVNPKSYVMYIDASSYFISQ